jgi:hypothetical protein
LSHVSKSTEESANLMVAIENLSEIETFFGNESPLETKSITVRMLITVNTDPSLFWFREKVRIYGATKQ